MGDCSVCCEKYNQTTRKLVGCGHCKFDACRTCHKTYILQTIQDPHCMGCKVPWDMDMILANFTKTFFHNELRKHREKVFFEREKSLLPATQQEMREEVLTKEMDLLAQLAGLYKKTAKEKEYLQAAQAIADELGVPLPGESLAGPSQPAKVIKPRPITKCIDEKCRGFIMSTNWRCGMCQMQVCHECLKEKTDGHKCTKEDQETRKLLLNNTKPCPKCGVMISKVDGCNMMWCVMCHTTFDWASGEMTTGHNHNPHYYEWLRRTGRDVPRDPGDMPQMPQNMACGVDVFPHAYHFRQMATMKYGVRETETLMGLHRLTTHIRDVELIQLRLKLGELNNNKLRKSFLKGDITEEEFKRDIFIRERARERNQSLYNVMNLFYAQLRDNLILFFNERPSYQQCMEEMKELTNYCNECFQSTARTYNIKAMKISLQVFNVTRV